MGRILWFDNDLDYLEPYVEELRDQGHGVTTVGTLADADLELTNSVYDLLILDVMIPTHSEEEEERYPPDATNKGTSTGLLYYRTWRDRLQQSGTATLVLTVRLDSTIRQPFIDAGLPPSAVARKMDVRDVNDFMKKVEQALSQRPMVRRGAE